MPQIRGLGTPVVLGEQQHITCQGDYHDSASVTFLWEKSDIFSTKALPGYLESANHSLDNTFIWALDYTFTSGDHRDILRCIVRVDMGGGMVQREYEAQVEERISVCCM